MHPYIPRTVNIQIHILEGSMQSLAAYSFQATVPNFEGRLGSMNTLIDKWLTNKGVEDPRATDGDFESRTGDGTGQFSRRAVTASIGSTFEVELIETAHTGAMFTTSLQITQVGQVVSVFASLGATPGASVVAPVKLYPRCPWIIRAFIDEFSDWNFAGQVIPVGHAFAATDGSSVHALCDALRTTTRKLPLVVVSMDQDEKVWDALHIKAAEHLVGLADVAYVDAESSWLLTDELGPHDSCYLGAVRLYWPSRRSDGSFEGVTWTAPRLAAFGEGDSGRNRFLAALRGTVMSTAALTMVQPNSFREVQSAATKERLHALQGRARDAELDSIVAENAKLSADLDEAKLTIANLQWKVAAANYAQQAGEAANDEAGDDQSEGGVVRAPPKSGETRYYKKIGSGGGVDALVETAACQHRSSSWRPAFKGDQAEKGLIKLEGRDDWQSLAHCGSCTGGGRWRVHW